LERKLDRRVFETAIETMKKYGVESILTPKLYNKRESIKSSLLTYYESTEEFEKCKYVVDFFNELELQANETILYNNIAGATGENYSDSAYIF